MNVVIEQSVAAWIKADRAFEGVAIHAGQSDEEIPNDYPVIYVVCNNTESPALSLYSANVQIVISTPEIIVGNLSIHESIVENMRELLRTADSIEQHFPLSARCVGAGVNKWDDSQDSGRWKTAVTLTLGIIDMLA